MNIIDKGRSIQLKFTHADAVEIPTGEVCSLEISSR